MACAGNLRKMSCRVRGLEITINVSSPIEQYRAETYASKEPETLDWLDEHLRAGDVFMDVGANIGLYSLYAAKRRPGCRVYAFEPESQNFSRLCANIVENGLSNITPCNVPLADRETFDFFYVGELQAGSALHGFGEASTCRAPDQPGVLRQGALAMTLDALVGKFGLPQPHLLKIDVDGTEGKILSGAQTVLAAPSLRTVLVEVNTRKDGGGVEGPEQLLAGLGFLAVYPNCEGQEFHGTRSRNVIFRRA
jgi:FkbM family methyltransferase